MKTFAQSLALAGAVLALTGGSHSVNAQADAPAPAPAPAPGGQPGGDRGGRTQRGSFNPEEFRQRMNERLKEQFGVTNDDEWKIISERIEKVMEVRRTSAGGAAAMFFGGGGPGGPGGPGRGPGGPGTPGGDRGGDRGPRDSGNPEADALRKAIESKASKEEIKAALAKFRETRKANDAKLEAAQEELLAVLTVQQEAVAVMMGLLK